MELVRPMEYDLHHIKSVLSVPTQPTNSTQDYSKTDDKPASLPKEKTAQNKIDAEFRATQHASTITNNEADSKENIRKNSA